MLTAPLQQADRRVEGPAGKARRVVPFPQRMSVSHLVVLKTDPKEHYATNSIRQERTLEQGSNVLKFTILEQGSQKPLEELGLATPRGWPDTWSRTC